LNTFPLFFCLPDSISTFVFHPAPGWGIFTPFPFESSTRSYVSRTPESCPPDKLEERVPLNRVNLILRTD
jgi:hypothetical protein